MFGALLTDLSKAFDYLSHDLLTAKLNTYGLTCQLCDLYIVILKIVCKEQKQTQNIVLGNKLCFGVPQGCKLGPLLFNIFLCDPFLITENIDIASYADDNTLYTTGNSIEEVIQKLENIAQTLFQWFSDNQMKANPDKCHSLCNSNSEVSLTIETQKIKNSKFEKLLGIKLDSKLNFNFHIHDIC